MTSSSVMSMFFTSRALTTPQKMAKQALPMMNAGAIFEPKYVVEESA